MAYTYATSTTPYTGSQTTGPLDATNFINTMTQRAYNSWGGAGNQWDEAKKAYDRAQGVADRTSETALNTSEAFNKFAMDDRNFWDKTYKPAMEEQMRFALGYTTPGRMMANRTAAGATVGRSFNAGMDAAQRDLESHNINPSAGRYAGLTQGIEAAKAAAIAGAQTKSDRDTEAMGQNYLANAIATGAALPGMAVNEAGLGLTAGNTALNAQLAPANSYFNWSGTAPEWTKIGDAEMQAGFEGQKAQTQAGLQGNELQEKVNARKAKETSGAGAAIGGVGGLLKGLGTVAQFIPGWGTAAGIGLNMAGSVASDYGGGSGSTYARGGMIKRYADGGMTDVEEEGEDPFAWEDEDAEALTPGVDDYEAGAAMGRDPRMVPPEASPSGGEETDDVAAMVNVGEFVVPKDVTAWLGEKFFQKLIEKSRAEMAGPQEAEPEEAPEGESQMAFQPTWQSEGAAMGA